jgi:hypothetical protein
VQLYGDPQADQICIPYDEDGRMDVKQRELTYKLLEAMELGVNIYIDKGSIYIYRRCKYVSL